MKVTIAQAVLIVLLVAVMSACGTIQSQPSRRGKIRTDSTITVSSGSLDLYTSDQWFQDNAQQKQLPCDGSNDCYVNHTGNDSTLYINKNGVVISMTLTTPWTLTVGSHNVEMDFDQAKKQVHAHANGNGDKWNRVSSRHIQHNKNTLFTAATVTAGGQDINLDLCTNQSGCNCALCWGISSAQDCKLPH